MIEMTVYEQEKLDKFKKACKKFYKKLNNIDEEQFPLSEKDNYEYLITPTGIGSIIEVRHKTLDVSVDVTDMSAW